MNMNPKLKVKTRILVLSLFLIFISCTDELYNLKEQHTGLDKNKISLAQFKKETTITVFKPIVSVPKTTSITSKGKLQLNDFSIDTLAIKKFIAKNNQTAYTFRIYPLSFVAQPNEIYNLVYRKVNTSWETAIFYLKRLPKENSDHKLFEKIERIDGAKVTNAVTSKSTLTTSNSGSGMCSYESLTIECDGSCDRQGYSECDGFACPTGQCVERSITYMYCNLEDYSGGGGGSGGTYGGTSGSEGGGNGSTNSGATTGSATLDPFTYFPNDLDSPFYEDPMYINSIKRAYIWDNLGNAKQRFFASNPEYLNYFNETIQYQINSNWSVESNEMGNWAREFKFDNPDTTWVQFENWFMGTPEGQDGEYDSAFWENPNLTFQQQNLPTLVAFKSAMPTKYTDAGTLCNSLGGDVLKMYNDVIAKRKKLNTCAIRVSTALIKCNISIPFIPDNPNGYKNTVKDKDGNYLIINAKALNKWMRKTFGTNLANYRHFTAAQGGVKGGNFPQLMEDIGSDGIYSMVSRPEIHGTWGTGHADILEEGDCRIKCHFFDENNNFVPVDYIDVWILK